MKKWTSIALTGFFALNAHADPSYCGYNDYFHLNSFSHPEVYIVGGYSDQDVLLDILGPRSFIVRDGYQCRTGYAHVSVAYDYYNWCTLTIKDGPLMNHPRVSATCSGLHYMGTDYDGVGSYSYTVNFE